MSLFSRVAAGAFLGVNCRPVRNCGSLLPGTASQAESHAQAQEQPSRHPRIHAHSEPKLEQLAPFQFSCPFFFTGPPENVRRASPHRNSYQCVTLDVPQGDGECLPRVKKRKHSSEPRRSGHRRGPAAAIQRLFLLKLNSHAASLRPRTFRGRRKASRLLACGLPPAGGHGADSCLRTHCPPQKPCCSCCCAGGAERPLIVVVSDNRAVEEFVPVLQGFCELTGACDPDSVCRSPSSRRAAVPESFSASGNSGRARDRAVEDRHGQASRLWFLPLPPPPSACVRPSITPIWRASCAAANRSTSIICSLT